MEGLVKKDEFKKIFEIFQPRFNKIWISKFEKILVDEIKHFKHYLNNPKNTKLFEDLKK